MNFKYYIQSRFSSCRKLADARDEHRQRDVSLFMLPGHFDHVGVTDGVDAWVAPTCINPFSVDVRKLLADVAAGVVSPEPQPYRQRTRVAAVQPPKKERIRART